MGDIFMINYYLAIFKNENHSVQERLYIEWYM